MLIKGIKMNYAIVLFNNDGLGMTIKEFTDSQQALDYAQTLKKYIITKETGLYLVFRSYCTNDADSII